MFTPEQPESGHLDSATRDQLGVLLCRGLSDSTTSLSQPQTRCPKDSAGEANQKNSYLTLLSLSSYSFHSLALIVANSSRATVDVTTDLLLEMGNTFCGSLKRQLSQHLPNLGMSTPNAMTAGCLPALLDRWPQSFVAECHDSRGLHVSGWLLLPSNFSLQFVADVTDDVVSTGELELF
ncbi:hypothetical protein PHACT_08075 [Pseudohongiella acticola]|uniref:Uncharacterized protein n=1 Tax=Pseudohongiella acticola TaxID=1524254 RepID=A0A1E8CKY8_9GAMM|nr:hypothetical protein [Pseudohongiella acticola]OFE13099.1 hypothetical protein PHACT_08075 [Pseudohongiella acticola]